MWSSLMSSLHVVLKWMPWVIMPWKCGKLLVWDATCPGTFASVRRPWQLERQQPTQGRGNAISTAVPVTHDFIPVAIETSGVGPQSLHFLRELGRPRRVRRQPGDPCTCFLSPVPTPVNCHPGGNCINYGRS